MIVSTGKAKEKLCPVPGLTKTGRCVGPDCMAWHFWIPPADLKLAAAKHGMRDTDKKGFCGRAGSY
jgi:hypothetical protein